MSKCKDCYHNQICPYILCNKFNCTEQLSSCIDCRYLEVGEVVMYCTLKGITVDDVQDMTCRYWRKKDEK